MRVDVAVGAQVARRRRRVVRKVAAARIAGARGVARGGRRDGRQRVEALSEEKRIALAEPNGLLASGEMLKGFVIEDGTATKLSTPRLSPTKAKSTIFNSGAPPPVQTQSSSYENPSLTFPVSLDSIFANHVGAPELL